MGLKDVVLGIAIIILTISVAVFGISTFFPGPEVEDYCPQEGFPSPVKLPDNTVCPTVCIEMYEIDDNQCVFDGCGSGCGPDDIETFATLDECEEALERYTCREDYDDAREAYSKTIFLIALPLGIIIIALGAFVFGLESVGAGLMGGGVGVILYGVGGFWEFAENWLKFVLSLVGLVIVIWLAYFWTKRAGKKKH